MIPLQIGFKQFLRTFISVSGFGFGDVALFRMFVSIS